jgi:hypothetical protein
MFNSKDILKKESDYHVMSWDSFFGSTKKTKKQRAREVLESNKRNGKDAEDRFVLRHSLSGEEVERTGRGSDFRVRRRDPWTGKVSSSRLYEVKSSETAPVSELQSKMRKKRRVTVVRETNDPWKYFFG